MGDRVEPGGEVTWPDGSRGPVLRVQHGSVVLTLAAQSDVLHVGCTVIFSPPVRQRLGSLPPEGRGRLLAALKLEISGCQRVILNVFPSDAKDVAMIARLTVYETVHLSATEASTRNRLMEALQEVANAGYRAIRVLDLGPA
jgi:hypothetical protein